PSLHFLIPLFTTVATLAVVALAWHWYVRGKYPLTGTGLLYRLSQHQGYMNALYNVTIVRPVIRLSHLLLWIDHQVVDGAVNGLAAAGRSLAAVAGWVDQRLVDGLVRFIGKIAWGMGNVFRRLQTGSVQGYFATLFLVILVILLYHIVVLI